MNEATQTFGPFLIPAEHPVVEAGWRCSRCQEQVRKLFKVIPYLIPRSVLYSCRCGTVVTWEDERQPKDAKHWAQNIKLLRKRGAQVVVFNGNKPTPPGFGGQN
jgi:hypothetical protein